MNARRLDAADGADRAGKLALERPGPVDVLHEAGGTERVGLVEDLVADGPAERQALLGKPHAGAEHVLVRHQDCGAVVQHLVGNRKAVELRDDRRGILESEVGVERRHLRRGDAQHDEGEHADKDRRDGTHGGEAGRAQSLNKIR